MPSLSLSFFLEVDERKNSSLNIYRDIYHGARGFFIDEKITWEIPSIFIIVLSGIARSGGGRRGDMAVVEGGGEDLELGRRREQSRR